MSPKGTIFGTDLSFFLHAMDPNLHSDFSFLIYTDRIKQIIFGTLIRPGYFTQYDADDLFQEIMEKLLSRESYIRESYKGLAQFENYFSVVVYKMCCEIRNQLLRERNHWPMANVKMLLTRLKAPDYNENGISETEKKLMIDCILKRLDYCLQICLKKKYLFILYFKILFGIPVIPGDLSALNLEKPLIDRISDRLSMNTSGLKKFERIKLLADISILAEKKPETPDAIRVRLDYHLKQIIRTLNGDPPLYYFNKDSFRELFELYCASNDYRSNE